VAHCRNAVATRFSRSDPDDLEVLSSKICREPAASKKSAVGAPANRVVAWGRATRNSNRERRNQTIR
jgi:hypothetical protein